MSVRVHRYVNMRDVSKQCDAIPVSLDTRGQYTIVRNNIHPCIRMSKYGDVMGDINK